MSRDSEQKLLKNILKMLKILNFSEIQAKSLILKFSILLEYGHDYSSFTKTNEISLKAIISSSSIPLKNFFVDLEREKVFSHKIPERIFYDIKELCYSVSSRDIYLLMQSSKSQKSIGQYLTAKEIIENIYKDLEVRNIQNQNYRTLVDFSAGLGDFVFSSLSIDKILTYAVELDSLSYEFLIFNILLNPQINENKKKFSFLSIKQGDALLGFNKNQLNLVKKHKVASELLRRYFTVRKDIVENSNISKNDVQEAIEIRRKISKFDGSLREFNWFIDFPELFLDSNLNIKDQYGFDYVVGNPPWINYKSFDKTKYSIALSKQSFSNLLYGKYNFALPFLILGYIISKDKGALIIPQGIIAETYAKKMRERLIKTRNLKKIVLCRNILFEDVANEYCILFWEKENKESYFKIQNNRNVETILVSFDSIKSKQFRIPTIPKELSNLVYRIYENSDLLEEVVFIRRGLTLTKQYQVNYEKKVNINVNEKLKPLIRHNRFSANKQEGVFNFNVYYGGEKFIYDTTLLGAPGEKNLFEREKIIRRNRGKKWYIGLDSSKEIYVNDIFDIMYSKTKKISLKTIFGYLSSTLIQFLAENIIQRDINSNTVRDLPFPNFLEIEANEIDEAVNRWIESSMSKEEFLKMRDCVDNIITNIFNITKKEQSELLERTNIYWKEK